MKSSCVPFENDGHGVRVADLRRRLQEVEGNGEKDVE